MAKKKSLVTGKIIASFVYIIGVVCLLICCLGIIFCYEKNIYFDDAEYSQSSMFASKIENAVYNLYSDTLYYSSYNEETDQQYDSSVFLNEVSDYFGDVNLDYEITLNNELYSSNITESATDQSTYNYLELNDANGDDILFSFKLDTDKPYNDYFLADVELYNLLYGFRYYFIAILAITVLILIVDIIYLCVAVGKKNKDDQATLNEIDKVPFDLYIIIVIVIVIVIVILVNALAKEIIYSGSYSYYLIYISVFIVFVMLVALSVLLTFVNRIKCGSFYKNTLIYMLLRIVCKAIISIPLTWKCIVFVLACYWIIPFLLACISDYLLMIYIFFLSCYTLYYGYFLAKIKLKTSQIARGDFEQPLNTKMMTPELKEYVNKLECINEGVSHALDEKMKSERFKAELITNVSHDIKTPLTSIINYIDLLKCNPDEIHKQEYLNILDKQSSRLKKLTEDIVEFSKVSTGNVKVNKEMIYGNEILKQTVGEYEELLKNNHLELICEYAQKDEKLFTDGKLTWRILNNCLNNIVKYSKKYTRVYIKSEVKDNYFVISMKNVSEKMLNISASSLLERFVRGDSSRNTEGSGLGLSIASDLAEILDGKFVIDIDGDLFKVTFMLPRNNVS